MYRWISEFDKYGDLAFPGKGSHDFIYQNKLKQLETENEQLKDELELLVERKGPYGKFIGCSSYPKCNYTRKRF